MKALINPRRLFLASATSVAAAAIVVSAIALPVQAADSNGSPSGTVTVEPLDGLWSDGINGNPVAVKTSLKCQPSKGTYPAGSTVVSMSTYVIAKQGKESPTLASPIAVNLPTDFSAFKDDFLAVNFGTAQTGPDGSVPDVDGNTFPGYASPDFQSWGLPNDGTAIADFSSLIQANSSYSLVAVCLYRITQGFNASYAFEPDSTGHLQAAWSTLATGPGTGDQLSWKIAPVTQPSNTSTASPTSSTTTSNSATPSSTSSSSTTGTGTPSASPEPTGTETSSEPPAPGNGTGAGITVELGKQYTVTAPASSFTADELINGEIHSTPLVLTETGTAAPDGSVSYRFAVPAELSPGQHTLVLTGAGSARTFSIPLTVLAAANNQPFQPLTNWVSNTAGTPGGMAGLFLILVLLSGAVLIGWRFLIHRPTTRRKH